ncbi:MAG TPA: hypothetical protein VFO44_15530 [Steroidobacteraceae bacterium]|nr:hypothetical protein [Steroidobacteraceae bacterium]
MLPHLKVWLDHFEYHSLHPRRLPEGVSDQLTTHERNLIARSIATFQLGEQSAGTHLLAAAYRFARENDASAVARATELLVREEQQHAFLLGRFMADHAIPARRDDWTDWVFRRVRRLAHFELYLCVLLTAELIGNVYYRALEVATRCQRLRLLCRVLVADELAHIGFESDLLLAIRARHAVPIRIPIELAHRVFFVGAAVVVWTTHRAVLRQAGYGLLSFLRACRAQFSFYLQPPPASASAPSAP